MVPDEGVPRRTVPVPRGGLAMLQRRLFAALVVALVAVLPLAGQEKDKDKGKDAKGGKAGDKAAAPAPAASGEKANLVWKFAKDKTFYQKMATKTTQKM